MNSIERGAGKAIYGESNDIAVRVESSKSVKGVAENCKFLLAVDHTSYFAEPKSVAQLEAVLIKINRITTTVPSDITRTQPAADTSETTGRKIKQSNILGFLAIFIQWIKNLF